MLCLGNHISREKKMRTNESYSMSLPPHSCCLPPNLCIFPLQIQIPKVTAIPSLASGDESIIWHCQQDVTENKPKCFHYFHPITPSYPLLGHSKYCNFTLFCFFISFRYLQAIIISPLYLTLSSFNLFS